MSDDVKRCGDAGGRTRSGGPCRTKLNLSPTSGMCVMHAPEREQERYEMRVSGAKARGRKVQKEKAARPEGTPRKPRNLADAIEWTSWATFAVATGEIDVRIAHEIAVLIKEFSANLVKRDLEKRVEELTAQLAEARANARKPMRVA